MLRIWFRVWQRGQRVSPPAAVERLPTRVDMFGSIGKAFDRDNNLSEIYVVARDAAQADQIFEQADRAWLGIPEEPERRPKRPRTTIHMIARPSKDFRFDSVLQEMRTKAGLGGSELARRAHVGRATLFKLETRWTYPDGRPYTTRPATAWRIALALGLDDAAPLFERIVDQKK